MQRINESGTLFSNRDDNIMDEFNEMNDDMDVHFVKRNSKN